MKNSIENPQKMQQKVQKYQIPSISELIEQFKSRQQYQKYILQCQQKYQLRFYRVHSFHKNQVLQTYLSLKQKYQKGTYKPSPLTWYQNQRKLYIWYIIYLIKYSGQLIFQEQNEKLWLQLSEMFFNKDIKLLKYYYASIQKSHKRVQWTQEEDDALRQAYMQYSSGEWNQIAKHVFYKTSSKQFKNPKHCRQRWNNHLNDKIRKDPWNDDDDYQMLNLIQLHGKKWSQLGKIIQGRTQHQIKNRFNSLIAKYDKKGNQEQIIEFLLNKYKSGDCKFMKKSKNIIKKQSVLSLSYVNEFMKEQNQQKRQQKQLATKLSIECQKNAEYEYSMINSSYKQEISDNNINEKSQNNFIEEKQKQKYKIEQKIIYKQKQPTTPYIINIFSLIEPKNQFSTVDQFKTKQQKEQKFQSFNFGGMSFVYTGRDKNLMNSTTISTSLEDKLLISTSQFFKNDMKSDILSGLPSIAHTPGHFFFEDSQYLGDDKNFLLPNQMKLDLKKSSQVIDFSNSMELLKAARLDLSEDLKNIVNSSNLQGNFKLKYSFSSQMKEYGS